LSSAVIEKTMIKNPRLAIFDNNLPDLLDGESALPRR
jgi:hypothetical protein